MDNHAFGRIVGELVRAQNDLLVIGRRTPDQLCQIQQDLRRIGYDVSIVPSAKYPMTIDGSNETHPRLDLLEMASIAIAFHNSILDEGYNPDPNKHLEHALRKNGVKFKRQHGSNPFSIGALHLI